MLLEQFSVVAAGILDAAVGVVDQAAGRWPARYQRGEPDSITIVDATQQKTVIPKRDIREERALTLSIMPEELLTGLSDRQLCDLFAYVQSEKAPR